MSLNIQDAITKFFMGESTSDRVNKLQRMGDFHKLSKNWNEKYLSVSNSVPKNARMFGLVIIDWDGSLRKRNVNIQTSDLEIPFQYLGSGSDMGIPTWTKTANYQDVGSEIIGRYENIPVYSNSSGQTLQLELVYHAEALLNENAKTYWTMENIEKLQKRIQSLVYPTYSNGYSPPSKVMLNIGNIWRKFPVVITSVSVKNSPPYHNETGLSMLRTITLECKSAYPMWQAVSADKVMVATAGNDIFAYQELNETVEDRQTAQRRARDILK